MYRERWGRIMAATYTDQEVRQNVWDEIPHDVRVDPGDVHVAVTDGIVYLDGTVLAYSQWVTAAEDARRIKDGRRGFSPG